ncbi:MAG: ATP-binding protein [Candidatus Nitrosopolaris sp.]
MRILVQVLVQKYAPRLFAKFSTKSFSGTGLELYISRNIIEAHDGKIWAKNNIDQGNTGRYLFFQSTIKLNQQQQKVLWNIFKMDSYRFVNAMSSVNNFECNIIIIRYVANSCIRYI